MSAASPIFFRVMSARGELSPELLSQIAVMPAFFPPIISEERTVADYDGIFPFEMCYFGKTGVKKSFVRLFKTDFFGKKDVFKIFAYSGVFYPSLLYLYGSVGGNKKANFAVKPFKGFSCSQKQPSLL